MNLTIAFELGSSLPAFGALVAAGLVGFLGYGVSLVLFIIALRHLGTARRAYFSVAPFIGAALALGVWLHMTEWHSTAIFSPSSNRATNRSHSSIL